MRKEIKYLLAVITLLSASGCKHSMRPVEYVHYIQNVKNGLKKVVEVGGWEYTLQYKPAEYIILFENSGRVNNDELTKRKKTLEGTAWFNISFKRIGENVSALRYNVSSQADYNERLNYFLNQASKQIELVYGTDTLHPAAYEFENNYNLTPQETMVVGFTLPKDGKNIKRDMVLAYNDPLFKNGIIKTSYTAEAINKIPDLIF